MRVNHFSGVNDLSLLGELLVEFSPFYPKDQKFFGEIQESYGEFSHYSGSKCYFQFTPSHPATIEFRALANGANG